MDFLSMGIPIGRYFGINVRLHFTFLIYAFWRATQFEHLWLGIAFILGLYLCILLHEFGHALAARWCDGDANEILLWPLGGLAYVRPAFHPTAHLITTVAGPFVTFVLWLVFWGVAASLRRFVALDSEALVYVYVFVAAMSALNLWLLIFNLIPAFPMDGGRILRDTLWHWMSAEAATRIAVNVSRVIAVVGGIGWALLAQDFWPLILMLFILLQSAHEQQIVAWEAMAPYSFSLRERLKRGRRQREFRSAVRQRVRAEAATAFHRCAVCGRTEEDSPTLDFRVCTGCSGYEEYCAEHIDNHRHT
jgi:Zn-dependent protease